MTPAYRSFTFKAACLVFLALVLSQLAACHHAADTRIAPGTGVFPGGEWRRMSPEEAGLDRQRLHLLAEYVGGAGSVVRHGRLVYTWGHYTDLADVASAAKPVYAHLAYQAVADGRIDSLDSPVSRFVPELDSLNSSLGHKDRLITWRHLLTQTSNYGVSEKPGMAFDYSDYQTALLIDALVFKVYGSDYSSADEEVLQPYVTDPLNCQDKPTIMGNGKSHKGRLRISSRDFARFGLLYLAGGRWGEEAIVDPAYVEMARSTPLDASLPRTEHRAAEMLPDQRSIGGRANMEDHMGSYSYFWWLNRKMPDGNLFFTDSHPDTFAALGHGGKHALVIIPDLDMVVSWVAGLQDKRPGNIFVEGRHAVNSALKLLSAALR